MTQDFTHAAMWKRTSKVPDMYRDRSLDSIDIAPDAVALLRKWIAKVLSGDVVRKMGGGVFLFGTPRRSEAGMATLNEILASVTLQNVGETLGKPEYGVVYRPVYWQKFSHLISLKGDSMGNGGGDAEEMLDCLRGTHKNDSMNVRVLCIDNVGSEYSTGSGWTREVLNDVLFTRHYAGLPTIVTSSVSDMAAFEQKYGADLVFLFKEDFVAVKV